MGWGGEHHSRGNWEKVQTHRREKVPLLRRAREGAADCQRKLPVPKRVHMPTGSQKAEWLWHKLRVVRSLLLI